MTTAILALALAAADVGARPLVTDRLARIDAVVNAAVARGDAPGAVVIVGRGDAVLLRRAYGNRALEPDREPMTLDTIFDVASLTKCVATAPSVMRLVETGQIRLADPVVRYLPEFAPQGGDRAKVTVEELLTHRAGFPPDDPLDLYTGTPEEIFARKHAQPVAHPPGAVFVYSDAGYEVLGELVERVSGERLDRFAEERFFRPLAMRDTGFLPLARPDAAKIASRIAPTERRDGRWMRGEVHDPRAYALGGVAGHAGLFSTADDLARFCRTILSGGRLGPARVLAPLAVDALTRPRYYGDGDVRALGFDVETAYSGNRGDLFPPGSFGHTGFTGTSMWIDPSSKTWVVFLSNRVHPDGKGDVGRLRGVVATLAAATASVRDLPAARRLESTVPRGPGVLAGIDVLVRDRFRALAGKRVGLLTHRAARARDGRTTAAVLASADAKTAGVTLARLFAPEHGVAIDRDAPLPDEAGDAETGAPVVSLYGERRRPRPEDLAGLDAIVVDLQDVGTRFYTYLTTLGYVLEEAAKAKLPVVVLDRPDPVGGRAVEGPIADSDALSFTAYHAIPVRTGMTIGELAALFDAERRIGADLTVVPLSGWSRALWYDETGLEWTNPSPNMRSLAAAALYPGIGLLERTNVSVGRGTATPFEVVGAPWLDGRRLARVLSSRRIPGVTFTPIEFTPDEATYAGQRCAGVRLGVVNREALSPVRLGIEIAVALRDLHAADWDRSRLGELLANAKTLGLFESGAAADAIAASWQEDLARFREIRARYLKY